jgi:hypothetical protein
MNEFLRQCGQSPSRASANYRFEKGKLSGELKHSPPSASSVKFLVASGTSKQCHCESDVGGKGREGL